MVFKKVSIDEYELVLRMEGIFWENFIEKDSTKRFLKNPMNWLYACILDNKIIGFAYGYELNRLNTLKNMMYIHAVSILPEFQRQGIGTKLMDELKKSCKENGIFKIFLFTQKSNIGACSLYEKTGGKLTEGQKDDDRTYFFNIIE